MDVEKEMQEYLALQRWNHGKKAAGLGRVKYRPAVIDPYTVVSLTDLHACIQEVNRMCRGGWTPLGGITVFQGVHAGQPAFFYLQAMVLDAYVDEDNDTEGEQERP